MIWKFSQGGDAAPPYRLQGFNTRRFHGSPENDVEGDGGDHDEDADGDGLHVPRLVFFRRFRGQGIDEALKFGVGSVLRGDQGNHDGEDEASDPGNNCEGEVLAHVAIEGEFLSNPTAFDAGRISNGEGKAVEYGGTHSAAEESKECAVTSGATPEHAEQECGEQRRVHEAKDKLEHVHDIIESGSQIRAADAD